MLIWWSRPENSKWLRKMTTQRIVDREADLVEIMEKDRHQDRAEGEEET